MLHILIHANKRCAVDSYSASPSFAVPVVPAEYSVRLVQGIIGDHEGIVEVYRNGQWGTVCDDRWGISDANVVCNQLGLGDAVAVPDTNYFGRGDLNKPILLDEVACTGSEQNLGECTSATVHDCTHSEDAGVRCTSEFTAAQVELPLLPNNRTIDYRHETFREITMFVYCHESAVD